MSLVVYEALTGVKGDPGWSRGKAAPLTGTVDAQQGFAENPQRSQETPKPVTSPLEDKLLPALREPPATNEKSLPDSWRNVVRNPPFVFSPPLNATVQEPVDSSKELLPPVFSQRETEQEEEEEEPRS
jgi:hypothetical protein